jgi:D-3-phosphoglycerate dehydrogenase / 2-oxoglutarate reductase
MIRILANDGIHPTGLSMLVEAGFQVDTTPVPQEELPTVLPIYDALIVRSATKVRRDLIDACPDLKAIARGGVGMDNIDLAYAREKGIEVFNTPAASSRAVAELAMGHMLSLARYLHHANREMPLRGSTDFANLKKAYSKGGEIEGRTLGIIGFGRIGQALAQLALGAGMKVAAFDPFVKEATLRWSIAGFGEVSVHLETLSFEEVLAASDYLSLHVPAQSGKALIGAAELASMKPGAVIVNTARGGLIDEDALLASLESGYTGGAGLDVFLGEPNPRPELLAHPRISVSPHTGASTNEAQSRIGAELAEGMIRFFLGK